MKKSINSPLKEHFQNTILTKIAPLQVHKLTCQEKNTVKQCILYNMHNRTIGKNGSVIEWTWKVDFIDPLASEIHIQGHGTFYLFAYEYFRNQCIHIVRDKWTEILYTVRVQPFPSYFGYIMHNNILMMLDLVAVTEY